MNTTEALENSHVMVIQSVDDLPESEWDVPGVCGDWSVKDIIAHLTSYEHLVVDVLNTFLGKQVTPHVFKFINDSAGFNDSEVEARKYHTAQQVLDEYQDAQVQSTSLLAQIPAEKVQQAGTMPWYGEQHCLADLVNMVYAHTCEHCTQIVHFREKINE
ncbi:MAG: DinB family protein [Chloroflexi bacterium]|nr:DinB family protein [Chloroflexota bacterium]